MERTTGHPSFIVQSVAFIFQSSFTRSILSTLLLCSETLNAMGEDDISRSSPQQLDSSMVSPPVSRKSVHQTLGGGAVADVLLWKRWFVSAFVLVGASIMWFLFERAGYNPLSFVANVLLILVVILFAWAKSASLLNRSLPPLPNMEVSEDFVAKVSRAAMVWVNRVLAVAHNIALARDFKIFLQAAFTLWLVSYIGSVFSFLSLVYIALLLSLTVPALYNKYQDPIDDKLSMTQEVLSTQFKKIDENILRKIPKSLSKGRKNQ